MAAGWWPQPQYRDLLAAIYRRQPRDSEEALLYGPDHMQAGDAAAGGLSRPRSAVLPHSGFAMVRSDDALERQSLALLKYGPHGGSHGHPDKLAITLYARGRAAAVDLGSQGYGIHLHREWYRQTVSHNTVLVSGRAQPPATGTLLHTTLPAIRVASDLVGAVVPSQRSVTPASSGHDQPAIADAAVSWSGASAGVYHGVSMRRAIAWRAPYFVDWFHVRCPARRRIDWLLHVQGRLRAVRGEASGDRQPAALPRAPGWRHITPRRSAWADCADGAVEVRWTLPNGALQVLLPDEDDTTLIVGEAPANPASVRLHSLVRTRYARSTTFVAVIHPCERAGALTAAVHRATHDTVTLEVVVNGRTDRWRLAAADPGHGPALSLLP
jgi:hypothetical protein